MVRRSKSYSMAAVFNSLGYVRSWPILLQNSLLRCQRAIIESEKPASRIRYCALWLVLESMLRVGVSKIVLQQYRPKCEVTTCASNVCSQGNCGRDVLALSLTG